MDSSPRIGLSSAVSTYAFTMAHRKLTHAPDPRYEEEVSGCTASVAIVSSKKIFVVCTRASMRRNSTDMPRVTLGTLGVFWESRAEPSHSHSTTSRRMRASPSRKDLNSSHTNNVTGEKARITAAGGFVDFGRVNGNLALSRAIGDFEFKKSAELAPEQQIVTAYPDVTVHDISDDDEFLVVACDGELGRHIGRAVSNTSVLRYLGLSVFPSRC